MDETEPATLLSCPHCRFAFHPKAASLTLDYCPRCLARRHVVQPLRRFGEAPVGADAGAVTWPSPPRLGTRVLENAARKGGRD
jgi:hypothetical protein